MGADAYHSNQEPQSLLIDPTPQRDHRIIQTTIAQGREARERVREGGRQVKKRNKSQKSYRCDVEYGGDSGERSEKRRRESVGSALIDVDPGGSDNNSEKAEREGQGTQG